MGESPPPYDAGPRQEAARETSGGARLLVVYDGGDGIGLVVSEAAAWRVAAVALRREDAEWLAGQLLAWVETGRLDG